MAPTHQSDSVALTYDYWAPVYDLVFGAVFRQGRRAATEIARRKGGRVLEIGVGTGLSLSEYGEANSVIGMDISAPMLVKARKRISEMSLRHVTGLAVMDAEQMAFPDASFDVLVAQYVVTAIPNPERALDEFLRVLRPGGEIIITSRISAEHGLRRTLEGLLMPLTSRLGWRTQFPWRRYEDWALNAPALRLVERRPIPPLGHFSLIRFAKNEAGPVSAHPSVPT
ncbi:methyltransferase domain-containing protein [Belnapia sp. T18]|uniref:Methyltransferase domain-containing protein n=1 Tax=Belnapia arida TaxID=2804533 RepID=A0ABS1UD91_9PROT|nr:methyltransferase domain-containing protein [Belnapia arida]MBL6082619.1 methyltransferase domain-containing protein [Belnapia arida]